MYYYPGKIACSFIKIFLPNIYLIYPLKPNLTLSLTSFKGIFLPIISISVYINLLPIFETISICKP